MGDAAGAKDEGAAFAGEGVGGAAPLERTWAPNRKSPGAEFTFDLAAGHDFEAPGGHDVHAAHGFGLCWSIARWGVVV